MNPILKTNKQLLAMLKEQISELEASEKERVGQPLAKSPSSGQAYFYKSVTKFSNSEKATGSVITEQTPFVQTSFLNGTFQVNLKEVNSLLSSRQMSAVIIDQDSAFVATDLYISSTEGQRLSRDLFDVTQHKRTASIVVENLSAGRQFTIPNAQDTVFASDSTVLKLSGDALTHFVNRGFYTTSYYGNGFNAFDKFYKLPAEYLLPRGAVLAVYIEITPRLPLSTTHPNYLAGQPDPVSSRVYLDFTLGGYKVYGA